MTSNVCQGFLGFKVLCDELRSHVILYTSEVSYGSLICVTPQIMCIVHILCMTDLCNTTSHVYCTYYA